MKKGWTIRIQGIVQGVGFRPFVKNLADSLGLKGAVINDSRGVEISLEAEAEDLKVFISRLEKEAPPLSHIISIETEAELFSGFEDFSIKASETVPGVTMVSPDAAVCPECRREILDKKERRFHYPFTNCTSCGPRYSITLKLPYDRPNTVMDAFAMCPQCGKEYANSKDRRFHAQPIACSSCGPRIYLNYKGKRIEDSEKALKKAAETVDQGGIIALKGLGGYHLICDAKNREAVARLRSLKRRKTKPLAVMCENAEILEKYVILEDKYRNLLTSPQSPIVIFDWKDHPLAENVNPMSHKIGVMTAYTPLHILLFQYLKTDFIVATSGNLRDEPIAKDEEEAEINLKSFTDVFLHHTRPIYNRLDDSVLAATDKGWTLLRRSRGFAPFPVVIKSDKKEEVFAAGANLKSGMAFYKDGFAFLSQYIGDLDSAEAEDLYRETYGRMTGLFGTKPIAAVSDIHPGYRSTMFAEELGIKRAKIQHHAAHFASCLAENAFYGDALGIIMDGFGLGPDGSAWGGEFFIKKGSKVIREASLRPFVQPGLDSAAKHPCRMAVSYLYGSGLLEKSLPYLKEKLLMEENEIALIKAACSKMINSVYSTSAGRLFEAAGSLILGKRSNEYEGELAVTLESAASQYNGKGYGFVLKDKYIDPAPAFAELMEDIARGEDRGIMAAKFHNGFIKASAEMCLRMAKDFGIKTVALSGGVFQNMRILDGLTATLEENGMRVLVHVKVPANDGGVALGQLYAYLTDMELTDGIKENEVFR